MEGMLAGCGLANLLSAKVGWVPLHVGQDPA